MDKVTSEIKLRWFKRTGSFFRVYSWLFKPLLITIAFLFLVLLSWLGFTFIQRDTYLFEVNLAVIGSLTTVLVSAAVAITAFWAQLKQYREADKVDQLREESWHRVGVQIGRLKIHDIVVFSSARKYVQWTDNCVVKWNPTLSYDGSPRSENALLEREKTKIITDAKRRAKKHNLTLSDDECVELRHAQISLVRDKGRRVPSYVLTPKVARYFDFLGTANAIDKEITAGQAVTSLRQELNINVKSIEDLNDLPVIAKLGCGTAAVTSDDQLVLGVRGRSMIAGKGENPDETRRLVHIVAEGMVPGDLDSDGRLSPRVCSARALEEELIIGNTGNSIGSIKEHFATGFFFDQLRLQPCFSYLAHLSCDSATLKTGYKSAPDAWEAEELITIPFKLESKDLRLLMLGRHPQYRLASNHAAAVIFFALMYQFGYYKIRDIYTSFSVF